MEGILLVQGTYGSVVWEPTDGGSIQKAEFNSNVTSVAAGLTGGVLAVVSYYGVDTWYGLMGGTPDPGGTLVRWFVVFSWVFATPALVAMLHLAALTHAWPRILDNGILLPDSNPFYCGRSIMIRWEKIDSIEFADYEWEPLVRFRAPKRLGLKMALKSQEGPIRRYAFASRTPEEYDSLCKMRSVIDDVMADNQTRVIGDQEVSS